MARRQEDSCTATQWCILSGLAALPNPCLCKACTVSVSQGVP